MHSRVLLNTHVVLRLPSGQFKIVEVIPNTAIPLGKYGSFSTNLILGRPYHLTYEILDKEDGQTHSKLRLVPASELNAEALASEDAAAQGEEKTESAANAKGGVEFDIVGENGELLMRSNRLTIDDPLRQTLTQDEIEELKRAGTGSGKDIIAKIMASHQALDEKTSFSLAKYTVRKSKKYLKRFTVLPMDPGMLAKVMMEREAVRIMELREEMLGLIASWANVHHYSDPGEEMETKRGGRWLIIDDTGGLLTAAMAERMGILYPQEEEVEESDEEDLEESNATNGTNHQAPSPKDPPRPTTTDASEKELATTTSNPKKAPYNHTPSQSSPTTTLTLLHPSAQPSLGLLRHFGFDTNEPSPTHPLHTHLKTLSWLSLLSPSTDPAYAEPPLVTAEKLATWKSGKRGTYHRKRRRWERVKRVVDETREGGFDGLVVATAMELKGVLEHTLPLLRGGAQVAVYSPHVEPLVQLMDLYSRERRAAFMIGGHTSAPSPHANETEKRELEEDFPLNPLALLNTQLQTARGRAWQVLPGRTHPFMTARGGAEGFLFSGTKVQPVEGRVEARGRFAKRRKVEGGGEG
ncbi:Gcd10p-domain-containing protein [Aulographum hederae CBS 113979]|uniref:tRNA (adenine(58)-N(1))-methyltransferase non-catalytic subunit TRM6 n=1 Tax=Aulographum hederae CBS 113979 TaxID=1176131 RepID=A0A6G1GYV8_9PEZI|nr:Gcd10p-domain-containing protein [Aulographum hederae CBS 113979]